MQGEKPGPLRDLQAGSLGGHSQAVPSSRTRADTAVRGTRGGPGTGGGQRGDKGAWLPQQQPGYKKQQVPTGATLPCSTQGEDEKGFPWLPLEEENIQIKPESKVHPVSFSLSLVFVFGVESREKGLGSVLHGAREWLVPSHLLPCPRPGRAGCQATPPGRKDRQWAHTQGQSLKPAFGLAAHHGRVCQPRTTKCLLTGGGGNEGRSRTPGAEPAPRVCALRPPPGCYCFPQAGLARHAQELPVRMFSDITLTWTSTECLEV